MKIQILWMILLTSTLTLAADRVYTADEVSNTVSVIDPQADSLVGVYELGFPRPFSHASFVSNRTQINVHGIEVSPDKRLVAVTSNITGTVVVLETQTWKISSVHSVGRSPHASNFTPDGKELWVSVRGEDHINIIDMNKGVTKQKLKVQHSPSFTAMMKTKPYAFISNCSSNVLEVYNWRTKSLIKKIAIQDNFSPVSALSPDEKELWLIQKTVGAVVRIDTEKLEVIEQIDTGHYTQHPTFLKLKGKVYGLATVGGENKVVAYELTKPKATLFKSVQVEGVPHSLVASADGTKIFVALEHGDKVLVVETNDFKVQKSIQIGRSPQAMTYVQNVVDTSKPHEINLRPLRSQDATLIREVASADKRVKGLISLRIFGHQDMVSFRLFSVPYRGVLKVYYTDSNKEYADIDSKNLKLFGAVYCQNDTTCLDEAIIPHSDENIEVMKNPKFKFHFVNSAGKSVIKSF